MICFKMSKEKYESVMFVQAWIWSNPIGECRYNPREYILDDSRWQIRH
jgi:hypothetical protein